MVISAVNTAGGTPIPGGPGGQMDIYPYGVVDNLDSALVINALNRGDDGALAWFTAVPEPSLLALVVCGVIGLAVRRRCDG